MDAVEVAADLGLLEAEEKDDPDRFELEKKKDLLRA